MDEQEAAGAGRGWAPTPWAVDGQATTTSETTSLAGAWPPVGSEVPSCGATDGPGATSWPGMAMGSPLTTIRPGPYTRFGVPALLFATTAMMTVLVSNGLSVDRSRETAEQGSPTWMAVIPLMMLATAIYTTLVGLLAKVEIDPDRIRVTRIAGFQEVARRSVTGVVRQKGRYQPQHLALVPNTAVLKGSALREGVAPKLSVADKLTLPGVRIPEISRVLGLDEPPRLRIFP